MIGMTRPVSVKQMISLLAGGPAVGRRCKCPGAQTVQWAHHWRVCSRVQRCTELTDPCQLLSLICISLKCSCWSLVPHIVKHPRSFALHVRRLWLELLIRVLLHHSDLDAARKSCRACFCANALTTSSRLFPVWSVAKCTPASSWLSCCRACNGGQGQGDSSHRSDEHLRPKVPIKLHV
jgi:hypothetical protein